MQDKLALAKRQLPPTRERSQPINILRHLGLIVLAGLVASWIGIPQASIVIIGGLGLIGLWIWKGGTR